MKKFSLILFFSIMVLKAQITDHKKAPNSYIFDVVMAKTNHYDGIRIPVKKAYDMWSNSQYLKNSAGTTIPSGTQSASVFWEDSPGLISKVEVEKAALPENSQIKITINAAKRKGNAVIAFKVDHTIYWSWHIWVTDNTENGVTYSQDFETDLNNKTFQVAYMDRNLGATSADFIGNEWEKSGGLLYEWGRKDPFPPLVYKDATYYELAEM